KSKGAARIVLVKIADNADGDGYAYPGERYLARQTGLSVRSVITTIQRLRESGELDLVCKYNEDHPKYPLSVRAGRGYKPTNLYRIVLQGLPWVKQFHPSPQPMGEKHASARVKSTAKKG